MAGGTNLQNVIKQAEKLVKEAEKVAMEKRVGYLTEVNKIRSILLKEIRNGKNKAVISKILKALGKTFPPYLYRLKKRKKKKK
jgi:hypothetical protein